MRHIDIVVIDEVSGDANEETLGVLKERVVASIPEDGVIILATTNAIVDQINCRRLSQINEQQYEYAAEVSITMESSWFPADEILNLKKGAQIMMFKNDPEKRWVNRTIGTIHSLNDNEITVNIDGMKYPVSRHTWSKIRHTYNLRLRQVEDEIISSFTQFPLRLA